MVKHFFRCALGDSKPISTLSVFVFHIILEYLLPMPHHCIPLKLSPLTLSSLSHSILSFLLCEVCRNETTGLIIICLFSKYNFDFIFRLNLKKLLRCQLMFEERFQLAASCMLDYWLEDCNFFDIESLLGGFDVCDLRGLLRSIIIGLVHGELSLDKLVTFQLPIMLCLFLLFSFLFRFLLGQYLWILYLHSWLFTILIKELFVYFLLFF